MTIADVLGCADPEHPPAEKDHFYATPPDVTEAFIQAEGRLLPEVIWEPACGDGAICKVLNTRPKSWLHSTDLVDRGYGLPRVDFLMERKPLCPHIVTNPPFKLAHQFAMHAHDIGIDYMAMLVKADFFNSQRTATLFRVWQPARIYALSWRPDFKGGGNPPMTCSWVVFDGKPGFTQFNVLGRPKS